MLCPSKNQPEKDLVMTPPEMAREVMEHFRPTGRLLDPCRGEGAFYDAYHGPKDWCEISEGRNFYEYQGHVDWIVTNPPWSDIRGFVLKGMQVSENVVYLAVVNHFTTKARLRDIYSGGFGLKELYCMRTPSPSTGWKASGFQVAACHIQRGWDGPTLFSDDGCFGRSE